MSEDLTLTMQHSMQNRSKKIKLQHFHSLRLPEYGSPVPPVANIVVFVFVTQIALCDILVGVAAKQANGQNQ